MGDRSYSNRQPSTTLRINCVEGLRINYVEVDISTPLNDQSGLAVAIKARFWQKVKDSQKSFLKKFAFSVAAFCLLEICPIFRKHLVEASFSIITQLLIILNRFTKKFSYSIKSSTIDRKYR
ncbi:MAG: hypothetical protein EAZ18_18465 [Oscillatoriales cyanobacterium]|nr:MAG: hypothetical protein EAZ18_18465 [Oscillatoriales cyanobacterium]